MNTQTDITTQIQTLIARFVGLSVDDRRNCDLLRLWIDPGTDANIWKISISIKHQRCCSEALDRKRLLLYGLGNSVLKKTTVIEILSKPTISHWLLLADNFSHKSIMMRWALEVVATTWSFEGGFAGREDEYELLTVTPWGRAIAIETISKEESQVC